MASLKLSTKTITGSLHQLNKNVADWGWQGFLAYGCQTFVVIIDPNAPQVVQTLEGHKGYVVKVKWARENYHHDLGNPFTLRLASADYNGKIIVWNAAQGSILSEFSDGSKPVTELEWLSCQDASHDLLVALHPPYNLVLWNTDTGIKLWKKSYTETLLGFAFDPFDPCRMAFLGQDCLLFVDDFSQFKTPSSNGRKFYVSNPSPQSHGNSAGDSLELKPRSAMQFVSRILVGDSAKRIATDESSLKECLQLAFHQSNRHILILLYSRELLLLDLDMNQTVGVLALERSGSPFVQVYSMQQRDVLMCLHDNGSVSVRVRKLTELKLKDSESPGLTGEDSNLQQSSWLTYSVRSQSDALRLTRHVKVYAMAHCPVRENKVALVLSDGRVLSWDLVITETPDYLKAGVLHSALLTTATQNVPGNTLLNLRSQAQPPKNTLFNLLSAAEDELGSSTATGTLSDEPEVTEEETNDENEDEEQHKAALKFVLGGLLPCLTAPPFIIRMSLPLTTKNWTVYQPILAIGTLSGHIQLWNISGFFPVKELSVHSSVVKGIEWCSLHTFLSFSSSYPNSNGLVKNEVMYTDTQNGKSIMVRPSREEESPIEMIKVSHLKLYFVIVFKDQPMEMWEARSMTLLRQMPRHFPRITALEWSTSHLRANKKSKSEDYNTLVGSQIDLSATTPEQPTKPGLAENKDPAAFKEHFVFTDPEGLLYHFFIEGNVIKEGSRIPPDGGMSTISYIAWKSETLVLGDVEGNLNIWDLKGKVSKAMPTHKGCIKRIKFAPGRGNMRIIVLQQEGVDVWDAKQMDLISSLRTSKEGAKFIDADWSASDKPILACADGTLRVLDTKCKMSSAPVDEYLLQEEIFSPHLLPMKSCFGLRCLLQHQTWRANYSCLPENLVWVEQLDGGTRILQQLQLMDRDVLSYLDECIFGTAERCLITARVFGDESDVNFWTLALHYLRSFKANPKGQYPPPRGNTDGANMTSSMSQTSLDRQAEDTSEDTGEWNFIQDQPLESCMDILCDNLNFRKQQVARITAHEQRSRGITEQTRRCAARLILLGETDRAVQLLLETDAHTDGYYTDCLKACLAASVSATGASQSTIKLVATNLIANGKLAEGTQLLCMIDKGLDACRYLMAYGEWNQATWLAKATLDREESTEVIARYVEHLSQPQVNRKSLGVLVLLSLGHFNKVLQTLYSQRHFDRAALFAEALCEFDLVPPDSGELIEAVYLEYARFLLQLNFQAAAVFYCGKAGEKGGQLLKEIKQDFGDTVLNI